MGTKEHRIQVSKTAVDSTGTLPVILIIKIAAVILFAIVLVRTAWLNEDAFITFRSVDNFLHGHGLTWNTSERVQTYTSPLWMMLITLTSFIFGATPFFTILFSLLLSLAFVIVLFHKTEHTGPLLIIAAAILTSKAFTDFSTSGLENPLTHILALLFLFEFINMREGKGNFTTLCLYGGLIAITRLDHILLILPAITWLSITSIKAGKISLPRVLRSLFIGFSPIIIWTLFSLFYYGFPLPNTFYAKINPELLLTDRITQGVYYLENSLSNDPITIFFILFSLACLIFRRRAGDIYIVAGIIVYLLYLLYIGADYMSGRFLSILFAMSLVMISRQKLSIPNAIPIASIIFLFGLVTPLSPIRSTDSYGIGQKGIVDSHDIADERAWQYQYSGLLRMNRNEQWPSHPNVFRGQSLRAKKPQAIVDSLIGYLGYYSGPDVHIIDMWALADPLLARLPPISKWKPGMYTRIPPCGYINTIRSGKNRIVDPGVAAYYDKLRLITSGPLFSPDRLLTTVAMNLHMYDHLLQNYIRNIHSLHIEPDAVELVPEIEQGTITSGYLEIDCSTLRFQSRLTIKTGTLINFDLYFFKQVGMLSKQSINRRLFGADHTVNIQVPWKTRTRGYDTVFIVPHRADKPFILHEIRLEDISQPEAGDTRQ